MTSPTASLEYYKFYVINVTAIIFDKFTYVENVVT